ncbi:MAG: two-component system sensor histidine kinase NtrB [Gemmatimonadaceae bacterium]
MSAPSTQPDASGSNMGTERHALDAAIALAPTISLERVLQETVQQLRRTVTCEAIVIVLSDVELGPFEIVHQSGLPEEPPDEALRAAWRRAVVDRAVTMRERPRGREVTVPLTSGDVHGALTVVVSDVDTRRADDEIEQLVATIATQAAHAIDRAKDVHRLTQRRRLEAIGEVSAGIARELRNPLFGISSAAQLLRFRVRDDPVIERNVGRILREVERLNGVVSSLLEYGTPAPMQRSAADPDAVWQNVLAAKRGLLESKALAVRHQPADPRVTCDVDAEQLSHVFVNVLSNAVDAAPEGSDLFLASTALPSGGWRCRLHNEGAPIPSDVLPRLFELFFSTKPGGAGVGLALCQRILDDHGGSISIESTADKGTTVTIALPNRKSDDVPSGDPHG